MNELWQKLSMIRFGGNTIADYVVAFAVFFGGYLLVRLVQVFLVKHLQRIAKKTETSFDDFIIEMVGKVLLPLGYLAFFYAGIKTLELGATVDRVVMVILAVIVTYFSAYAISRVISYGFDVYLHKAGKTETLQKSLNGILRIIKILVWGLAVVFFLDNMGFRISAVIAGLGVGGVAMALAAQAVLGDLFSYFAILFDRPFEVGDFIIVGDFMGVVEYIGIKTTRICSLGGEQVIFSNSDLTSSRVRNYRRMRQRRVVFRLGVTYDTSLEKLKKIPGMIKEIIDGIDDTRFDRAHFFSYGDFNLIYEVVYYLIGSDYNKYMDIQQAINFGIKDVFTREQIEFAFPTQTIYVNKE